MMTEQADQGTPWAVSKGNPGGLDDLGKDFTSGSYHAVGAVILSIRSPDLRDPNRRSTAGTKLG